MKKNLHRKLNNKDLVIKSIVIKSNINYFIKGSMEHITLNKEYEISNQIKTSMMHIVGFLDDNKNHCCFYLKPYGSVIEGNIKVIL